MKRADHCTIIMIRWIMSVTSGFSFRISFRNQRDTGLRFTANADRSRGPKLASRSRSCRRCRFSGSVKNTHNLCSRLVPPKDHAMNTPLWLSSASTFANDANSDHFHGKWAQTRQSSVVAQLPLATEFESNEISSTPSTRICRRIPPWSFRSRGSPSFTLYCCSFTLYWSSLIRPPMITSCISLEFSSG